VSSEHSEHTQLEAPRAASAPALFVVNFEYAQHSFKCVRLELTGARGDAPHAEQWVVTEAGRPVWSFVASQGDTRASVQAEVQRWWDSSS
jgi:hypothetical protein